MAPHDFHRIHVCPGSTAMGPRGWESLLESGKNFQPQIC
jgi:hypothetical protein